jgi:outer membrane phospholipase A
MGEPCEMKTVGSGALDSAMPGIVPESMTRWPVLTLALAALPAAAAEPGAEPGVPLTVHEPVYFIMGTRGGTTARFQLSFQYRLFDREQGWGEHAPWLARLHFGYTQTSFWNLSGDSRPFRDTSYRPSLFYARQGEPDDPIPTHALRAGVEHESNGKEGADSRSINILFVRPEWRWALPNGKRLEFAPKLYGYLDKEENPDIHRYRGYADWQLRYGDDERSWLATARLGTAGKGSLTLDWFERARGRGPGLTFGYFHVQFFAGYGEDILDYDRRFKSQLRFGYAIVP